MSFEILHAEDVHVPDRQRSDFDDKKILDLADSITRVGLIHAPVVTKDGRLVAGERRLRALAARGEAKFTYGTMHDLEYPHEVPFNVIDEENPRILFEIELEENLRRVNLSAMEEAKAIAELHNVRVEEVPSRTMKETSEELASIEGHEPRKSDEYRVADSILVDQFKDDPEVQAASKISLRKAARVARKKMELEFTRALGSFDEVPVDGLMKVFCGDAIEHLKKAMPKSFDILLFDPPYGIGADKFGDQAMALGHQYKDDKQDAIRFTNNILFGAQNFLKPDAHLLMFCAFESFEFWRATYEEYDFKVWPRPLIWDKGSGHAPVPYYGPAYSYECILFATRGERQVNKTINDVLRVPSARDKIHAAEKPAELLGSLIDFVARPGDRILDPCCGSGSIFLGAKDKEVYVTGIEISEDYAAISRSRIIEGR